METLLNSPLFKYIGIGLLGLLLLSEIEQRFFGGSDLDLETVRDFRNELQRVKDSNDSIANAMQLMVIQDSIDKAQYIHTQDSLIGLINQNQKDIDNAKESIVPLRDEVNALVYRINDLPDLP